jgi:hypothetical protein
VTAPPPGTPPGSQPLGPTPPPPPAYGPGYWPYGYAPPPRPDHTALLVVVVVVLIIVGVALPAILYVMVSNLIQGPVSSRPLVTFISPTKVNAMTWTLTVASAQPQVAPSNYQLNFGIGAKIGTAVNMGPSNVNTTVAVFGATPSSVGIRWTDLGGTGRLKGGDTFTIAFPSAPATGTSLTFYLLYVDGTIVQSSTWQA